MAFKFKVLSIDGGGIKGIIPAKILEVIERRTGKRIFELFDLIAGTSTGGILTLGLTKPKSDVPNTSEYKVEHLIDMYKQKGEKIFQRRPINPVQGTLFSTLKSILNQLKVNLEHPEDLFYSKYTQVGRADVIANYLGKKTPKQEEKEEVLIQDALTEVLITSYETQRRLPIFFTSNSEKETINNNFHRICQGITMYDAAMATSAAPTYFKPHLMNAFDEKTGAYTLIDGGVFANNPTTIAIIEAMNSYYLKTKESLKLDDILVISLGTGSLTREFSYDEIKNWGQIKWGEPLINVVLDSQSEVVAYQLEQLLQPQQYFRFQPQLSKIRDDYGNVIAANDDMDDASKLNIENLEAIADTFIRRNNNRLKTLMDLLVEESEYQQLTKVTKN